MGILNVTPDSFSDGSLYFQPEQAIARGKQIVQDGADILDIGGESTRPGSEPVSEEKSCAVLFQWQGTRAAVTYSNSYR